jgi:hypothetical protein
MTALPGWSTSRHSLRTPVRRRRASRTSSPPQMSFPTSKSRTGASGCSRKASGASRETYPSRSRKPAGTPKDIIDKLYREIARIVMLPEVKERLATIGYTAVGNTPEEFSVQIKRDIARWAKVIREAGIKQIQ